MVAITAGRMLSRRAARLVSRAERCLVVGGDERVEHVCHKLDMLGAHTDVVAGVRLAENQHHPHEELRALIAQHDVHRVVLAPAAQDSGQMVDLVRIAKAAGVRVSILPRVFEALGSAVHFEQVEGMTMLGVRRLRLSRSSLLIKRTFDLVVGGVLFVAMLPIFVALAVAIRLDSPGPIFFRQVRIGRGGRPFKMWKFRSMVCDADTRRDELAHLNEAGAGMFKLTDDPRVTRVGRFLRRTSLDELPQMLNVMSGDMSLVGPRPLVVDEDARVQGIYRARLHLTPGMTGAWQILGSVRVPMDEMVSMDYLYVANWSLWSDVKLLLRTVPHVLAGRGL
jgi:exopolysaccharide biosynthesis polyprenyl glycosylphosphotransferase